MLGYVITALLFMTPSVSPALAVDTLDVKAAVKGEWTTFAGEGLPRDGYGLYTAEDGSIWWGVEDGVIRYDGSDWIKYSKGDGLFGGAVRGIIQAADGALWFAGSHRERSAVARYSGSAWRIYSEKDGLVGDWASSLAFDAAGNLWVNGLGAVPTGGDPSESGSGVVRSDGKVWRNLTEEDGLLDNRVYDIAASTDGMVWFATHGGVSCFDGEKWTSGLVGAHVHSIFVSQAGKVWTTTSGGYVLYFDGRTWERFSGYPLELPRSIYQGDDEVLWLGTHRGETDHHARTIDGLLRYSDGITSVITSSEGLPGRDVHGITHSGGELWMVVPNVGLVKYRPNLSAMATISGSVTQLDGSPQIGIEVQAESTTRRVFGRTLTDADGRYRFSLLPGSYQVSAIRGQGAKRTRVSVAAGRETSGVNFAPDPEMLSLARNVKVKLQEPYLGQLSFGELMRAFGDMGDIASRWGLMALDKLAGEAKTEVLGIGLRLLVDGTERQLMEMLLEREMLTLHSQQETRYGMIREGTVSMGYGDNPRIVEVKLRAFHLQPTGRQESYLHVSPDVLADRLRDRWISRLEFDEITQLYTGMAVAARREGRRALQGIAGISDDELFNRGLRLLTSGEEPQRISSILQAEIDRRLRDDEIRFKMAIHGILSLQARNDRGTIERGLWLLYLRERYGDTAARIGVGLLIAGLLLTSTYAVRKRRDLRRAEQAIVQEMTRELQTAHDLQMSLMPSAAPDVGGLDVAGRCVPANHVGGDYFQYFKKDRSLIFVLADVTGDAMEAAIPVVMFDGILDRQMESGGSVKTIFNGLNGSLCRKLQDRTFVCFVLGEIDHETNILRLSNAGCPYPYHHRAATGDLAELEAGAYPLGVRPDTDYEVIETHLEVGDRIILCSDGIVEAADAEGRQLGFDRTAEAIRKGCVAGMSADATIDLLLGKVNQHRGDVVQADDMTCVVVRLV